MWEGTDQSVAVVVIQNWKLGAGRKKSLLASPPTNYCREFCRKFWSAYRVPRELRVPSIHKKNSVPSHI